MAGLEILREFPLCVPSEWEGFSFYPQLRFKSNRCGSIKWRAVLLHVFLVDAAELQVTPLPRL
jgi:hypothetical protein